MPAGPPLEARDRMGRTPLHYAVCGIENPLAPVEPSAASVRALIEAGADVNASDSGGWRPLHFAATSRSNATVVGVLISAGAEVDVQDNYGNTPLWRAVFEYRGDGATILALLEAGARPNVMNTSGVSPRELAHTIDNTDVAKLFD